VVYLAYMEQKLKRKGYRLRDEDAEYIREQAKREDRSMSSFLRRLIEAHREQTQQRGAA
jgi:predicted CopG family antitoxin